ncbi:nucleotidyl transferase AbiEii/AbiGii toxin family protein [Pedobacter jeongneungensis]|uniref:nucleotidyl transferase AbiEii/AbiGii toxin family protein n=1 Tax=Pedobacter jeongneungensis TaxID=947309 RepID=UPI0031D4B6EE
MYWNTVNQLLKNTLLELMQAPELAAFRLVGGTALSLYLGHRLSVDIDLFYGCKIRINRF